MRVLEMLRRMAVAVIRILPRMRGRGRLALAVNAAFLRTGVNPLITVEMNRGHRLVLDTRVVGHVWALFEGYYDDANILILSAFMGAGGVCLDVGANIGFYTIPLGAVARAGGGKVIAFEPLAANARRLTENIALNGLDDVILVQPIGLSSAPAKVQLSLREDFEGGGEVGNAAIVLADGHDDVFRQVTIEVARLDDLWPRLNLDRLDVVKADIEGHEDYFLEGARETLKRHRPIIQMEVNPHFFERRGIALDVRLREVLPTGYVTLKPVGAETHWSIRPRIVDLVATDRFDQDGRFYDVFLVPIEKVDALRRAVAALPKQFQAAHATRQDQPNIPLGTESLARARSISTPTPAASE